MRNRQCPLCRLPWRKRGACPACQKVREHIAEAHQMVATRQEYQRTETGRREARLLKRLSQA